MIFDILEEKLTVEGYVTPGESLFRNFMPADCMVGVLLRVPLQGIDIDPHREGWYRTQLQVITRHTNPVDGMAFSKQVTKILFTENRESYPANEERGAVTLDLFYPDSIPIQFPRLEGNGYEWSQHFKVVYGLEPHWR